MTGVTVLRGKKLHRRLGIAAPSNYSRAVDATEDYEFDDVLDDDFLRSRASDQYVLEGVPQQQLDDMMERHGLRAILATVRALCSSRADPGCDESMDFETLDASSAEGSRWSGIASALERFLNSETTPS